MVMNEDNWEKINQETGINIHTLIYIYIIGKQVTIIIVQGTIFNIL